MDNDGTLERIAFDSSTRALDKQQALLDEIRARTGLLLAASSLAASLLGVRAIEQGGSLSAAVALAAFALSAAACLFVLLPRPYAFTFSLDGPSVYEELFQLRGDPTELHRRLAYNMRAFWDANDRRIQPLFHAFRLAALLLFIEIAAFLAAVGGTLE